VSNDRDAVFKFADRRRCLADSTVKINLRVVGKRMEVHLMLILNNVKVCNKTANQCKMMSV